MIYTNCPNCGEQLIQDSSGMQRCRNCQFQCFVNEIKYMTNSHLCMICGGVLNNQETQICGQCKSKILNNWSEQNE